MGKQHRRQLEKQVQFQLSLLMLRLLDKDLVGRILHEKIVPQEFLVSIFHINGRD